MHDASHDAIHLDAEIRRIRPELLRPRPALLQLVDHAKVGHLDFDFHNGFHLLVHFVILTPRDVQHATPPPMFQPRMRLSSL